MSSNPGSAAGARGRAVDDWRASWSGLDQSSVMGVEMMAGILAWGGVGYLVDRWLGTWPWLFGIGTMVGFAGGLTLVYIRSTRMEGGSRWAPPASGESQTGEPHGV